MYLRQLAGKPGTILNVSSSVSTTTNEGLSSYASAKTAINRFSEFVHLGKLSRPSALLFPKTAGLTPATCSQNTLRKASAASRSIPAGSSIQAWASRRRIISSRICTTRWIWRAGRLFIYPRSGLGFWMGGLCFRIMIWRGWRG